MPTILILLPTSGQVATGFLTSIIGLTQQFARQGITFGLKHYEFSDLVVSRNYLMSYFLSDSRYTHALMLDSDLIFKPDQILRMLEFDRDFVAAPYPRRTMSFDRFHAAVLQNEACPPEQRRTPDELAAASFSYTIQPGFFSDQPGAPRYDGSFVTSGGVGAGCVLLRRAVPEAMVARGLAHPLPFQGAQLIYADAPRFHDFFSHKLNPAGDFYYGEDQSFCHRWVVGCGGDLWVDTCAKIGHVGAFTFWGDPQQVQSPPFAVPRPQE